MPIRLTDLLARVPREVETEVRRVRDQARSVLQEALRSECRLALRTKEELEDKKAGAQVPVEISPGHPASLDGVVFAGDLQVIALLGQYRAALEGARSGADGLLQLRQQLFEKGDPLRLIRPTEGELRATRDWAAGLLELLDQHDPLRSLLGVNDDILGVYEYEAGYALTDEYKVNRATIRLYWAVIGLVAEWMGRTIEDLTVVVLTHELAHAYTQLGADIEGRRWPAAEFARAETELKEGLAQYYTHRVLDRLKERYRGAMEAYEAMLPIQPPAYRTHLPWVKEGSPEAMRRATLEVRRWKEGKLADFSRRLVEANRELKGKNQQLEK